MPDTRNERLALTMEWKKVFRYSDYGFPAEVWVEPNEEVTEHLHLPDFANDTRAAMKWTLPFLWEKELRVDFATTATGVLLTLPVRKALKRKPLKFNGRTISLALAAAVEAQSGCSRAHH